jgi:Recombination endonuclease VII
VPEWRLRHLLEGGRKQVDHDHERRLLRDLLCDHCNKGLGHFQDDPALVRRGADYLDFWRQCHEAALKAGPPSATAGTAHPHGIPVNHFPIPRGGIMTPDEPTEDNRIMRHNACQTGRFYAKARAITRVAPLRDDPLQTHLAGVRENGLAVVLDVPDINKRGTRPRGRLRGPSRGWVRR